MKKLEEPVMKVYAAARIKLLNPAVLSLALGLISGIASFALTLVAIISRDSGRLIHLFESIYPGYSVGIVGLILGLLWGFVYGYILGFLVAYLYTYLIKKMARGDMDPVFKFDPNQAVNVIKEGQGTNPYTIVIVANPVIYHKTFRITVEAIECLKPLVPEEVWRALEDIINHAPITGRSAFLEHLEGVLGPSIPEKQKAAIFGCSEFYDGGFYEPDPIFKKPDLFWKAVIRCLKSFVNNELLRLPEIFPRLKIVVIYDHKTDHALSDENALCETIDPQSEIIAPRDVRGTDVSPVSIIENYVKRHRIDYCDVIMAISGSQKFINSSARFTQEDDALSGAKFHYINNTVDTTRCHPPYAKLPGVAAIWAGDDRLRIPVHEFAHAMSSFQNGPIVDEYDDEGEGLLDISDFIVNKQFRSAPTKAIPRHFAKYGLVTEFDKGCVEYCSHRTRADKEPDWTSYVPEGVGPGYSSIMDIAYYEYRFNKLVFDFMYDRLMAKLNRNMQR